MKFKYLRFFWVGFDTFHFLNWRFYLNHLIILLGYLISAYGIWTSWRVVSPYNPLEWLFVRFFKLRVDPMERSSHFDMANICASLINITIVPIWHMTILMQQGGDILWFFFRILEWLTPFHLIFISYCSQVLYPFFLNLSRIFLTKIIYYICVTLSLVGSNFTTNIKYIKTIYIYTMNQEVKNQLYMEPKYLSTFTPFFLLFFNNKLLWTRFSVLALFRSMFDNHGF